MKSASSSPRFKARSFWATALGLTLVCAAALYTTGQIIQSGYYLSNNPWLTAVVFFAFWFPALLIVEYVLLLFVPLQWSTTKARAILLACEALVVFAILIYERCIWTSETLIGTPWIVQPQLTQLFLASCIAAIIARVIFFSKSDGHWPGSASREFGLSPDSLEPAHSRHVPSIMKQTGYFFLHAIIIIAILVFGWLQISHNLSGEDYDLQNDDFLQYGAAVGYLKTGEYVDWNFTKNEIQLDAAGAPVVYDRAWISTWQIAQSMQLFGETEWAARLLAVIWFLVFLLIIYITAFVWTRSFVFATLAAVSPIFFDGVVLHARMVRMYSPVLTIATATMITFWYTYLFATTGKYFRMLLLGIITAGLFVFGWLHHELILILAPGMIVFIAYEWVRYIVGVWARKRSAFPQPHAAAVWKAQIIRTIFLCFLIIAALVLWVANEYLDSAIFTLGHLGLRNLLNMEYEFLVFMDFALPLTLMTLYLLGIGFALLHPRSTTKERYLAVVSLTVMVLLLVVVKRYKAYRYIQFLLPVVWGFLLLLWYRWLEGVVRFVVRNTTSQVHRYIPAVVALTFFVIFVPIGFAGVAAYQPFLTVHESSRLYEKDHGFDTQTAYQFIRKHKSPSDPVFTLSFRDQYWRNDPSLKLLAMGRHETYTLGMLHTDRYQTYGGKPVWFVWEDAKDGELLPEVKREIVQYAHDLSFCTPELAASGMHIYYWGDGYIPCDRPVRPDPQIWLQGNRIVTHALGNVGEDIRTNSKEALQKSFAEGDRVIEADFVITKDGRLVIKHDWLVEAKKGKPPVERPQNYQEFMASRIKERYTPLDAAQLLKLIEQQPDAFLVIDAKNKDYDRVLRLLKEDIERVNPALFSQIILQIYHPEDLPAARRFSPQSHILYTLYRTTLTDEEVVAFVQKERIPVVTISTERFSESLAGQLSDRGAKVFVHTINDPTKAKSLMNKGAYGVYSDTLIEADLGE